MEANPVAASVRAELRRGGGAEGRSMAAGRRAPWCDLVRASILVLAVCGWVTACSGSLFRSKAVPPSIYLLSAPPGINAAASSAPAAPAPLAADLAVLKPRGRAGLDTD